MKRVILCVDDFGLKPEVNEAVAELVDLGLVTATGCLSQAPAWREGAALLKGTRRARLDVGLHLNLTERFPPAGHGASPWVMPLGALIARALLRRLDERTLHQAVVAQLDAFESVWGAPPDFVDGHQHVHQLPQVRDVLLSELLRRYGPATTGRLPWLRCTAAPRGTGGLDFKARVIESLGAPAFARRARAAGFTLNGALLGVYGFDAEGPAYEQRVRGWLSQAREGDVLMMHPARPAAAGHRPPKAAPQAPKAPPEDAIAHARAVEYGVWRNVGAALLRQAQVEGGRMRLSSDILPG